MGTFPPKRPNFLQISQSGTFPTKLLNQSRRISHWGRFRGNDRISAEFRTRGRFPRNGRINQAEFFETFSPKWPNQSRRISAGFRLGDVSYETAEFPPNFSLGDVSNEWPGRIFAQFRT
ncbi:MAG: hypothetical protein Q8881_03485 [Sweet potato little leaf phytoplasma]|nr:hypothetical protein [Sweet potato little leaf phytoplasma]